MLDYETITAIKNPGARANAKRRAIEVEGIKAHARSEISDFSKRELWLIGLSLYWAEGGKSIFVDFANSNPDTIVFMVDWLRQFCDVGHLKFRIQLHLHSGQNEEELKRYWSKLTDIPISQFHKSSL